MVQITPFMLQGIRQIVRFPLKFIEQAIHLLYTFFKSMTLVQNPYPKTISALPEKAAVIASKTLTPCLHPVLR